MQRDPSIIVNCVRAIWPLLSCRGAFAKQMLSPHVQSLLILREHPARERRPFQKFRPREIIAGNHFAVNLKRVLAFPTRGYKCASAIMISICSPGRLNHSRLDFTADTFVLVSFPFSLPVAQDSSRGFFPSCSPSSSVSLKRRADSLSFRARHFSVLDFLCRHHDVILRRW